MNPTVRENLERAHRTRMAHAQAKRRIASLPRDEAVHAVIDILQNPGPELMSLRVGPLLRCIPRIAHVKVRKLLMTCNVFEQDRRIKELSPRQLALLQELLELWIAPPPALPLVVCALHGCHVEFEQKSMRHRFCCEEHQKASYSRNYSRPPRPSRSKKLLGAA